MDQVEEKQQQQSIELEPAPEKPTAAQTVQMLKRRIAEQIPQMPSASDFLPRQQPQLAAAATAPVNWTPIAIAGMGCFTLLTAVHMIVGSSPGARNTAAIERIAQTAAENKTNYEMRFSCVFGCGEAAREFNRRQEQAIESNNVVPVAAASTSQDLPSIPGQPSPDASYQEWFSYWQNNPQLANEKVQTLTEQDCFASGFMCTALNQYLGG